MRQHPNDRLYRHKSDVQGDSQHKPSREIDRYVLVPVRMSRMLVSLVMVMLFLLVRFLAVLIFRFFGRTHGRS